MIIIGGGAAGMACAAMIASNHGVQLMLFEKNEKLGKKIYITGKGRCNFTNACEPEEFLSNVVTNRRFLYSAFSGFNNQDAIRWFESLGVKTKIERGMRAFPASDHASDIIRAMEQEIVRLGVEVYRNAEVQTVLLDEITDETDAESSSKMRACGVRLSDGTEYFADAVIVATGGLSYETTGSTGDGYRFASEVGLAVTEMRPSLVALKAYIGGEAAVAEEPVRTTVYGCTDQRFRADVLEGLSLKNVTLSFRYGKKGKKRFSEFGEMLFTHDGISGPLVLTASAQLAPFLHAEKTSGGTGSGIPAQIDLKPALTEEQLDARLLREFDAAKNRTIKNVIAGLLPAKLRPVILPVAGIDSDRPVHEITKAERQALIGTLKAFPLTITGSGGFREAVITQGGVSVKEIDPKTMETKKVSGLYFIGEVLDLDALTGGFNLQIAWTTAHAAAEAIRLKCHTL